MTQERFSTLEECCEFARRFDQLAEQKSKEEIKEDVIAMHIALVKHIDKIINRVYTRHKLSCKCKWAHRNALQLLVCRAVPLRPRKGCRENCPTQTRIKITLTAFGSVEQ